jgi:hypothetical protein
MVNCCEAVAAKAARGSAGRLACCEEGAAEPRAGMGNGDLLRSKLVAGGGLRARVAGGGRDAVPTHPREHLRLCPHDKGASLNGELGHTFIIPL